jgi:hypothetical protein
VREKSMTVFEKTDRDSDLICLEELSLRRYQSASALQLARDESDGRCRYTSRSHQQILLLSPFLPRAARRFSSKHASRQSQSATES